MSKTRARPLLSMAVLLAVTIALMLLSKNACAAGACDTEDFYPSEYYIDKYNWGSIDVIMADYKWDKKSKYFVQGNRLVFDYYRTVNCTNGADKDVYDYDRMYTSLPEPHRVDIEEYDPWNPKCWISPRSCNEEAEVGTNSPHKIEVGRWYYLDVYFRVKSSDYYGMRIEPEVEPVTTITPPPWEEWCELACYYTKAGSSGW